jgi:predicted ATP-dependent protease
LAEILAILSSLADAPLRQDIAITGSINQWGEVQPVGGVIQKIEGFYRTCRHRELTGTQGVIIPKTNIDNVVLRDEIRESVAKGDFSIWPVSTIDEALEILTSLSPKSVFKTIKNKLATYHKSLEKMK